MRPTSPLAVNRMSVLSILLALFTLVNLAPAQTGSVSKRKLTQHGLPVAAAVKAQAVKENVTPLVTTDTWTGGGGSSNTNWSDSANWNSGVPVSGDAIVIGTTTATSTDDLSLSIATLTLSNSGDALTIANGVSLTVGGTISNAGSITLGSSGGTTELVIGANLSLTGDGSIILGSGGPNYILGSATLTNSSQTIEGTGNVGDGQTILVNNSVIDANVSGDTLNLVPGGASTNTATLEATSGGTLELSGASWTNTGGTISAGTGSAVVLNGTTITGGTLTTSGTGVVSGYGSELVTLTNAGTFAVPNGQTDTISGTINNTGTIQLNSSGGTTELIVASGGATLSGGGTVVLGYGGPNYILGSATLTNSSQTIEGVGNIGDGETTLVNNSTIDANVSPTVSSGALTISPGSGGLTNTATLEATNGGTLVITGATVTNSGSSAVIEALGTDSSSNDSAVFLVSSTINGGKLVTNGSDVIYGENATLVGVTNAGTFAIPNGQTSTISGTIDNTGTIELNSSGGTTELIVASGGATLSGGGTVVLGNGGPNYILGSATLTNSSQTIEGVGIVGNGQTILVNQSIIDANVSGGTLNVMPGGTSKNSKEMEATSGGTLELSGASWTNTGGTISAGTGSAVVLNGTTITGGKLSTSGTGVVSGYGSELVTLTNAGTFAVPNGQTDTISGTIDNTGTIELNSSGGTTELVIGSKGATLTGSGTVVLGSGGPNYILGSGATITNSGNTIEGTGNVGNGSVVVNNQSGSIIANVSGDTLIISSSGAGTSNTGTFEGTNTGTLIVQGTLTNYTSSSNSLTGGSYVANGGSVLLPLGSSGGISTLSASVTEENGGQIFNSNNSNNNALDGLTSITSTGSLTIGGVAFTDTGSFSNAGSLTILSGESFNVGSLTQISSGSLTAGTYVLDANLDLTGTAQTITTNAANLTLAGGTIENTSNSTNALAGLATNTGMLTIGGSSNKVSTTASSFSNSGTLTIDKGDSFTASNLTQISGTTLSGGTFVLDGNLDLTTTGISVTTNSSTLTLAGGTIDSGSSNALAALAANTKSLTIAAAVSTSASSFSNTGTLTVDTGDSFTAGNLTQISSGTLTAGTYLLEGNLDLTTSGISITTNDANLTLEGGTIESDGANALSALASNTGSLTIATKVSTSASSFSNAGTLTIDKGDSFTAANLSQISSGTLTAGTYVLIGNLDLTTTGLSITSNAATLTLEGGAIDSGTTNALSALTSNSGTLSLASSTKFTTASSNFTNTGTVNIEKGTTLTVGGSGNSYNQTAGTTNVDGTLSAGTSGAVNVTGGTMQGAGTIKATVSNDATFSAGDAGKAGLLTITGTYSQLSSATLNVNIGGTTLSTQYSQLKISGAASLGGTLNATLINSFTPTVGQAFTILTATSITGTFTNTTIAINSSEHFAISYTSTSVILTVVSGEASSSGSGSGQPAAQALMADPKKALSKSTSVNAKNDLRHAVTGTGKRLEVASLRHAPTPAANALDAMARIWEHIPAVPSWDPVKAVMVAQARHAVSVGSARSDLAYQVDNRNGVSHAVPVLPPLADWTGVNSHRLPARIPIPSLPMIR